ncbi:MAG: ABC transporter permease [Candidatus Omnitrophica bacterium]|nr:ABC transporter permease [Candidatus Omnitrophota bacterium]
MSEEQLTPVYQPPDKLLLKISGDWRIASGTPSFEEVISQFKSHNNISRIFFDTSALGDWDSGLAAFLLKLSKECAGRNITLAVEGLPQGAQKLLALARTVHEKNEAMQKIAEPALARIGTKVIAIKEELVVFFDFLGELSYSFMRLITGKSSMRWPDFFVIVQSCGAQAFPLVSLISVLVGLILAFVGAMQLKMFGAQIFVADIVGIAMVRVMGAIMTGIIMTGRTGASFAAELGIMQTNEEIDALKTLGISPIEHLVLPRVLALVLMMPLLTLYANLMGILGGYIIGVGMLELNPIEYFTRTQEAVAINNLWVGLVHSVVFGIIIAISGCFRGIQCGRSASAVGESTTAAVVNGITNIVIATAIITYICQLLGV